ncbi:hypothetical protein [Thalassoporum mexicanum]|uniref:hypothetical protein n=1 Tax=Thalassoporum mexicanum TaxID=3457544 RepID=UPI0002D2EC06|nr:hypothetical protein [Pseudanabaena sp. PCC 7367]
MTLLFFLFPEDENNDSNQPNQQKIAVRSHLLNQDCKVNQQVSYSPICDRP